MRITFLFLDNIAFGEMIAIFFIILVLFGPKKIPEIARGFGKAVRYFSDATTEIKRQVLSEEDELKDQAVKETKSILTDVNSIKKDIDDTLGSIKRL